MFKNLLLTSFLFCSSLLAAQSYDAAIGLRLGTDWGATAQIRLPQVHKNFVAEAILQSSLQKDQGSLTILGKQHRPLLSRRINLFYGAGAHFGWSNELDEKTGEEVGGPIGIDGVLGLEATFGGFNLAYDFKPAINVGGGSSFLETQTAISIRFVVAKRNDIWDKKKEKQNRQDKKKRQRAKKKEDRRKEREKAGKKWYEFGKKKGA
jgi:hypothetical protein